MNEFLFTLRFLVVWADVNDSVFVLTFQLVFVISILVRKK